MMQRTESITGILTEGQNTKGEAPTDVIFDDSNFEQVANIKPTAMHRNVDLAIFQADKEGAAMQADAQTLTVRLPAVQVM